jgi:hypothetical protein
MSKEEAKLSGGAVFFIPGRRVTTSTLREFVLAWLKGHNVKGAIDNLCTGLHEELYLPLSTAYEWLALIQRWCRLEFERLGTNPNGPTCLFELRQVPAEVIAELFRSDFPGIRKPP